MNVPAVPQTQVSLTDIIRANLVKCYNLFLEARTTPNHAPSCPNFHIFFAAIRTRFLRYVKSCVCVDFNVQLTVPINKILNSIVLLQQTSDVSESEMLIPAGYNRTADSDSRKKLQDVLETMGNTHNDSKGPFPIRAKPIIITDPTHFEPFLHQIKSLENTDPKFREWLHSHCAKELSNAESKDIDLLAGIAEDDDILRDQIKLRQTRDGHFYTGNEADLSRAVYGDEVPEEFQIPPNASKNHYEKNIARNRSTVLYGNKYGGKSLFE